MPTATDVTMLMKNRLVHEYDELQAIRKEMEKLVTAYNRFVDLATEKKRREQRIRILMALLPYNEHPVQVSDIESVSNRQNIPSLVEKLRQELPLWKAIREYLRVTQEAKVAEVVSFLVAIKFMRKVARQAIESAVRRHPQTFRVVKRGKEKFISLKSSV